MATVSDLLLRIERLRFRRANHPIACSHFCVCSCDRRAVGFEGDERKAGRTHKNDPAIDGEREFVNDTLLSARLRGATRSRHAEQPSGRPETGHGR